MPLRTCMKQIVREVVNANYTNFHLLSRDFELNFTDDLILNGRFEEHIFNKLPTLIAMYFNYFLDFFLGSHTPKIRDSFKNTTCFKSFIFET